MHEPSSIKRVALYARVSSEEQKDGQTIDSQIAELQRHATDRDWIVADIYKDDGWSGGLLARPELDRLRDDASKSLFEAILVNDVDRLARDVAHLGVIKRSLERNGVQLIFRKLPSEAGPMRNLMVNILGSFAEFEKELIADRTRRGRRHKVEVRKKFIGCLPPYGYDYIDKASSDGEGMLRVNEEEALVVRRIYSWVDKEGLSARRVIQRLNQTGLRPRNGARQWARSSVLRILRRQTYAGIWHYNKHESFEPTDQRQLRKYKKSVKSGLRLRDRADWIAVPLPQPLWIVEPDVWRRVQDRLDQNICFSLRNAKHFYLLRGLVRCGGCQARFVGDPCHRQFYYRCHRRCKRVGTILEYRLDEAVWNALREAILNPELIFKGVAAIHLRNREETQNRRIAPTSASRVLAQLDSEEARILEAYRLAIISPEQLERELTDLASRRKSVQEQDTASQQEQPPVAWSEPEIAERIEGFCKQIARKLDCLTAEEKQTLIRCMIDEITFDGTSVHIRALIPYGETLERAGLRPHSAPSGTNSPGSQGDFARRIENTKMHLRGRNPSEVGGIETTTPYSRGRNPSDVGRIEDTTPYPRVLNTALDDATGQSQGSIVFELVRAVEKGLTEAAKQASLRNLAKASQARWPRKPQTNPDRPTPDRNAAQ
jgi:site-specific DNA recombinase